MPASIARPTRRAEIPAETFRTYERPLASLRLERREGHDDRVAVGTQSADHERPTHVRQHARQLDIDLCVSADQRPHERRRAVRHGPFDRDAHLWIDALHAHALCSRGRALVRRLVRPTSHRDHDRARDQHQRETPAHEVHPTAADCRCADRACGIRSLRQCTAARLPTTNAITASNHARQMRSLRRCAAMDRDAPTLRNGVGLWCKRPRARECACE